MVSKSTDIHPTVKGMQPRDHVICNRAQGGKDCRLCGEWPIVFHSIEDLVL